jgi:hypothetical protein
MEKTLDKNIREADERRVRRRKAERKTELRP